MILHRRRITLHLRQDRPHHRITQDLRQFGILGDARCHVFFTLCALGSFSLLLVDFKGCFGALGGDFGGVFVVGVEAGSSITSFQAPGEIAFGKQQRRLPDHGSSELGIQAQGRFTIFQAFRDGCQFQVTSGTIGIRTWVLFIATDGFGVGSHGFHESASLEMVVAFISSGFGEFGIVQGRFGAFLKQLFGVTELGQRFGGAVLSQ